jgi:hypothetical protein
MLILTKGVWKFRDKNKNKGPLGKAWLFIDFGLLIFEVMMAEGDFRWKGALYL